MYRERGRQPHTSPPRSDSASRRRTPSGPGEWEDEISVAGHIRYVACLWRVLDEAWVIVWLGWRGRRFRRRISSSVWILVSVSVKAVSEYPSPRRPPTSTVSAKALKILRGSDPSGYRLSERIDHRRRGGGHDTLLPGLMASSLPAVTHCQSCSQPSPDEGSSSEHQRGGHPLVYRTKDGPLRSYHRT